MEADLRWIRAEMEKWYTISVRAVLGMGRNDDKEVTILNRKVRWEADGIKYEADERHREKLMDFFEFDEKTKVLGANGDRERKDEEWEEVRLSNAETTTFRGVSARLPKVVWLKYANTDEFVQMLMSPGGQCVCLCVFDPADGPGHPVFPAEVGLAVGGLLEGGLST